MYVPPSSPLPRPTTTSVAPPSRVLRHTVQPRGVNAALRLYAREQAAAMAENERILAWLVDAAGSVRAASIDESTRQEWQRYLRELLAAARQLEQTLFHLVGMLQQAQEVTAYVHGSNYAGLLPGHGRLRGRSE
jgi:hypothetical protein